MIKSIGVPLTNEEKQEKGRELAEKIVALTVMQDEHKSIKKDLNAAEEMVDAEIQRLARLLRDGREMREVDCDEVVDFETGRVNFVEPTTRAVITYRYMTAEEKIQGKLQFEGPSTDKVN